jgi:hypothetical protein
VSAQLILGLRAEAACLATGARFFYLQSRGRARCGFPFAENASKSMCLGLATIVDVRVPTPATALRSSLTSEIRRFGQTIRRLTA